jgi:hypothetical protein
MSAFLLSFSSNLPDRQAPSYTNSNPILNVICLVFILFCACIAFKQIYGKKKTRDENEKIEVNPTPNSEKDKS